MTLQTLWKMSVPFSMLHPCSPCIPLSASNYWDLSEPGEGAIYKNGEESRITLICTR